MKITFITIIFFFYFKVFFQILFISFIIYILNKCNKKIWDNYFSLTYIFIFNLNHKKRIYSSDFYLKIILFLKIFNKKENIYVLTCESLNLFASIPISTRISRLLFTSLNRYFSSITRIICDYTLWQSEVVVE